ncbi:hypothetical protein THAOC_29311, partial [Thalassiosira oceanica]
PDRSRRHGIVSALPGPSCRAAGGLWRPPESRAFPTSKLTIYLDDESSFEPSQRSFDIDYSMMQGRIGDPKTSAPISGIRGFNKQPRADAPFGPDGDDNGPGSEPPPQDRIGFFMAVMPSRRRPPAAVRKPSFPYFKADYLPDDGVPAEEANDLSTSNLRDSMAYERSEGLGTNCRNPGICAHQLASAKTDSFVIVLSSCCRNNFGRESVVFVIRRAAQPGKEGPGGAASESRLDWRGGWGGVGWVGARENAGHLARQPTGPLVCVSFVQLSLGGGGAEVVATGERGVGWVGARVDAGLLAAQPTGPGAAGRRYDDVCVVAVG